VLSALHLLTKEKVPTHVFARPSMTPAPSAEAIVRSTVKTGVVLPTMGASTPGHLPAFYAARRQERFVDRLRLRWPVFLCGFVAGVFGGMAVMKSPMGQRPAVQYVVKSVQSRATSTLVAMGVPTSSRTIVR
jgi:hypothetical protein